jgi:hypothetical protein
MKKARKVPAVFASEAEERAYWENEDSTADLRLGPGEARSTEDDRGLQNRRERLSIQSRPE